MEEREIISRLFALDSFIHNTEKLFSPSHTLKDFLMLLKEGQTYFTLHWSWTNRL